MTSTRRDILNSVFALAATGAVCPSLLAAVLTVGANATAGAAAYAIRRNAS